MAITDIPAGIKVGKANCKMPTDEGGVPVQRSLPIPAGNHIAAKTAAGSGDVVNQVTIPLVVGPNSVARNLSAVRLIAAVAGYVKFGRVGVTIGTTAEITPVTGVANGSAVYSALFPVVANTEHVIGVPVGCTHMVYYSGAAGSLISVTPY